MRPQPNAHNVVERSTDARSKARHCERALVDMPAPCNAGNVESFCYPRERVTQVTIYDKHHEIDVAPRPFVADVKLEVVLLCERQRWRAIAVLMSVRAPTPGASSAYVETEFSRNVTH
jgi:hypothetical protein